MRNKFALLFLAIIILSPLVIAQEVDNIKFVGKQNSGIEIIEYCFVDGFPCGSTYLCNITITSPLPSVIVANEGMTNNTAYYYNYTIANNQTSLLGTYQYTMFCSDGFLNASTDEWFEVTPSGIISSTSQGVIFIGLIFFTFIIFLLSLYGAVKLPYSNRTTPDGKIISINDLKYLKIFLLFMTYSLFMLIVYLSWNLSDSFLYLDSVSMFFWILFSIMLVGYFPIIMGSMFVAFTSVFLDKKLHRLMERGLQPRR